jgi:hypothetical protein
MQYKTLLPFLRGGWGRGGPGGCVCKSYSMDSLLLSKILPPTRKKGALDIKNQKLQK